MPLMTKTLREDRENQPPDVISFFMSTPYKALARNPELLANRVTIVGKVIYKDTRLPKARSPRDPRPLRYIDADAVATFAPALKRAPGNLLRRAGLSRANAARQVRRSVTVRTPVTVLLPIAIYQ